MINARPASETIANRPRYRGNPNRSMTPARASRNETNTCVARNTARPRTRMPKAMLHSRQIVAAVEDSGTQCKPIPDRAQLDALTISTSEICRHGAFVSTRYRGGCASAGLAGKNRSNNRAVRRGINARHRGTPCCRRLAAKIPRQLIRRREQTRCERQSRHRCRSKGCARWLDPWSKHWWPTRHQYAFVRETSLRSAQRYRAGHPTGHAAKRARGEPEPRGQSRGRARLSLQEHRRQVQFGFDRERLPVSARAGQDRDR